MKNMDKGLAVLKWGLINGPKIPQMAKLSAQAQNFGISMKKGFIGVHSPCQGASILHTHVYVQLLIHT